MLGAWNLEFVWILVLGIWNLFGPEYSGWCLEFGICFLLGLPAGGWNFPSSLHYLHTQPFLCRPAFGIGQADEEMIVAFIVLAAAVGWERERYVGHVLG